MVFYDLAQAYQECERITSIFAKTFYLGTKFMSPVAQKVCYALPQHADSSTIYWYSTWVQMISRVYLKNRNNLCRGSSPGVCRDITRQLAAFRAEIGTAATFLSL